MADKYLNPELVKLAAEIKAIHYNKIATTLFDLADKIMNGKMELVERLSSGLSKDAEPAYLSPQGLMHAAEVAQNTQDRMLIGSHLCIAAGGFRDMKEAYEQMRKTGEFFPEDRRGQKLDLNPEYTALELAASEHSK